MNLIDEEKALKIKCFVFFSCVIALAAPCYTEKVVVDYNKDSNFSKNLNGLERNHERGPTLISTAAGVSGNRKC